MTPEETTIREALNAEWSWSMGTRTRADALAALDALVARLTEAEQATSQRMVCSDYKRAEIAEARVKELEQERDSWQRIARQYESALSDKGLL